MALSFFSKKSQNNFNLFLYKTFRHYLIRFPLSQVVMMKAMLLIQEVDGKQLISYLYMYDLGPNFKFSFF